MGLLHKVLQSRQIQNKFKKSEMVLDPHKPEKYIQSLNVVLHQSSNSLLMAESYLTHVV